MARTKKDKARKDSRLRGSEPPSFAFESVPTRVLDALGKSSADQFKLSTVVAPTGYGKTVLVSSLYQKLSEQGVHCLWMSLEEPGISVERFQGRLESLIGSAGNSDHPAMQLIDGDVSMQNRIDGLIEAMSSLPDPTVVMIDNLGHCDDETLGSLLDQVIFCSPTEVRFVLVSASQVPINTARARMEGLLQEFGYQELSLQSSEIRSMLGEPLCDQIGEAGLEWVRERTEGWPAAIRMVQIVLSSAEDPEQALAQFSGSDRDLAQLLNRQVLAGFDDRTRELLLRLSLLRTFSADLARDATASGDVSPLIRQLMERNVFLIPLDRNRQWYRLHGLFREFLLGEAERELDPDTRRAVLERACRWCDEQDRPQDAVSYALEAGAMALAGAVLERSAATFVRNQGSLRQYLDWVEQVRARGHEVGWEADYWYVWGMIFYRRYESARQHYERLLQRLDQGDEERDSAQRENLKRRVGVIGVGIDTYTDQLDDASNSAERWLQRRGADDPFDVATVACAAAIRLNAQLRFGKAHEFMRVGQEAIAQSRSDYGVGWVATLRAMIQMQEGEFAAARKGLTTALSRASRSLGVNCGISGTLSAMLAKCLVELGAQDEAREKLPQGLRWAHTHGVSDTAIFAIDAALKLWSGDEPERVAELREIAASYPPRVSLMMSCLLVQRLVRLGRVEDARGEAMSLGIVPGSKKLPVAAELSVPRAQEIHAAAEIDLLIGLGQMRQAQDRIKTQTKLARDRGSYMRLVELALCEMSVAACSHAPETAARHLVRAVGLAAKRGILRPFQDRIDLISGVVNETKASAWGFALPEEKAFFSDLCRLLPTETRLLADEIEQARGDGKLLETPTARELELLGLIEAGLSNQQLADRLNLSIATVKWHLYNLYTKLGVSSRSAALAKAKTLNLLVR